jgi:hypothetical protein
MSGNANVTFYMEGRMEIPASTHPAWKDVLTGKRHCQVEFLGLQLIINRLRLKISLNPSPEILNLCVNEFREMFVKNANVPKVQRDLEKIFGKGGTV